MLSKRLKEWADVLKNNLYSLYLASKDSKVPITAKILITFVIAYAVSPIDLIPDFIPIIGFLDDLILLPMGIWLSIRLIPKGVWRKCQLQAKQKISSLPKNTRTNLIILIVIISLWILLLSVFVIWISTFIPDFYVGYLNTENSSV